METDKLPIFKNKMETDEKILKYYKFAYTCSCGQKYGSDKKEEQGKHICPICEDKNKR